MSIISRGRPMQLTAATIRALCPNARSQYTLSFASSEANALYEQHGFDLLDLAAFMAMISHESGGMTIVRENLNYSAKRIREVWPTRPGAVKFAGKPRELANCVYNGRMGNRVGTDDGYHFRGAAGLQATGRSMYQWLQKETGLPLADDPDYIDEHSECWPLVAIMTWCKQHFGDLNDFAGQGNFEACCKAINTGSPFSKIKVVGMADRERWYGRWVTALAAPSPKRVAELIAVYRFGSPQCISVENIQKRLNALRYAEGKLDADGRFGDRTRSAVMDFQVKNGLKSDGVVGPATWEKLFAADAVAWPPPAAIALGAEGLKATDPDVKQAAGDKVQAVLLGTGSVAYAANVSGGLDAVGGIAQQLGTGQTAITTIIGSLKFGAENLLWIGAAVSAVLLWRRFGSVVYRKIEFWTRPVGGEGGEA